jgi:hypothetical protein
MWDLRYKPRAYEYKMDLPAVVPAMREHEGGQTSIGLLLLALLCAILDLPIQGESGIEAGGNRNASEQDRVNLAL